MKRLIALALSLIMVFSCLALVSCGKKKSEVQKIIDQAQTMTLEELALKAYEESNGKKFSGVGNSSRGATALPFFVEFLQRRRIRTGRRIARAGAFLPIPFFIICPKGAAVNEKTPVLPGFFALLRGVSLWVYTLGW